jgi:hypothetical protein
MAGASHWSLAVDVETEPMAISFDIACRVKGPAAFLGSTYRTDGLIKQVDDRHVQLLAEVSGTPKSLVVEVLIGQIQVDAQGHLVVRPDSISDQRPATVRWKYRVRSSQPGVLSSE